MTTDNHSPLWAAYLRYQSTLDNHRYDAQTLGREEQLDEILNVIQVKKPCTADVSASLNRLPWNRAKKHLRMMRMLRKRLRHEGRIDQGFNEVDRRDEWRACAARYDTEVWPIEVALSEGIGIAEIAAEISLTQGSVKMRLNRARLPFRPLEITESE